MILLVMRLANMRRVHPTQDNARRCARCNKRVGIYPSGQAMLRENPAIEIVCHVCGAQDLVPEVVQVLLAPGALEEPLESVPNVRRQH